MSQVCALFGITRQAVYKQRVKAEVQDVSEHLIVEMVRQQRSKMPMIGGKKLHWLLSDNIRKLDIAIGRDKFFGILRKQGLLIQRRKRYAVTTNSRHRFRVYTNLIKDIVVNERNRVYVSDITYLRLQEGFCYLALVTDVYSRKIVGYDVSQSLSLDGALRAMKNALSRVEETTGLIHHSDRGLQYCSNEYVAMLCKHKISISMGENGNPYDNAIAERVNGILKTEFLLDETFADFYSAQRAVNEAIETYNNVRPHLSLNYLTPSLKYAA